MTAEAADAIASTEAQPVKLDTPHARSMLARRYAAPEWALMEEVAPATGGGTRYADAVAVNLWQSRGHVVHGFEIKVSRSDWQRELKDPAKAEPVMRYCDHWWIVAPRGVVKDGELPPTWGLLDLRSNCLAVIVNAPKLEAEPITREFFASLMRRGHEGLEEAAKRRYLAALADAREESRQSVERMVKHRAREFENLKERIATFERETGLSFERYSGPSVNAVKLAIALESLSTYGNGPLSRLTELAHDLEKAAGTVRAAVEASELAAIASPAEKNA